MAQNMNLGFRLNESPDILLKELVLSPLIYIRFLGLLCSIVVFGCISDKVELNGYCRYNNSNACSFGVAVGVIAFLLCLVFLVRDVVYVVIDFRNNVMVKKVILVVDAVANGLWTFMWFVAFVYLTDQWRKTSVKDASSRNCGNSGVAFSFFCMFIWVRNNYILCWSRVSS
ncbi:Synaptogyrin-1 [Geodia barretti]|uniref:Synaptogyrin-1 n=1 Tax=Geodia barretti TaxID=519541 RepID=A0AA35WGR4_GEOBA|nr:Synaptogyrin-1 [Geodia barretti]